MGAIYDSNNLIVHTLEKSSDEGIGSDIAPEYSGVQDGSAVTTMPYVSLDITDKEAVVLSDTAEFPELRFIPICPTLREFIMQQR